MTLADALYDEDFAAWLDAQAAPLREHRFADLDLDHPIEEVESTLGDPRRSWKSTADAHRDELEMRRTPSLRGELGGDLQEVYFEGRRLAATVLETEGTTQEWLPRTCHFTLSEILEEGWFPTNVYGLDRLET